MDSRYYILEGTTVLQVEDVLVWGKWFETAVRRLALTSISPTIEVSTVFLGLDHDWSAAGPPLLFETMVFQDNTETPDTRTALDEFTERWSTYHDAEQGHEAVCARVRAMVGRVVPEETPDA